MALCEPTGFLRPVAVGETFRRMASKVEVSIMEDRVQSVLELVQVGVKTSYGTKGVIQVAG